MTRLLPLPLPLPLLLLIHHILAQDITTLESSLPQCATTCVQQGTLQTGCDISNFACHCANYATMAAVVGPCLQQSQACTADEVTSMYSIVNQICAWYGELPASIAAAPVEPVQATTSAVAAFPTLPPESWLISLPPSESTPAALPDVGSFLPTVPPAAPSAPAPVNAVPSAPGGAPGGAPIASPTLTTLAPSFDPTTGLEVTPVAAAIVQKGRTTLSVVTSATPTTFAQGNSEQGVIGAAGRLEVSHVLAAGVMMVIGISVCLL